MGRELQYPALPPESGLIELARALAKTDPDEAQRIQFVSAILRGESYISKGGAIWDWCHDARDRFPGMQERQLDLGRAFDKLHYLLSEERRARDWDGEFRGRFDKLIAKAFGWGEAIAPSLVATQGRPLCVLCPATVKEIGERVARIEFTDIAANFDPPLMESAAVYKAYYAQDNAESLYDEICHLGEMFEQFKSFFMRAAVAGETVVYWID